jgi:hypothetical protein
MIFYIEVDGFLAIMVRIYVFNLLQDVFAFNVPILPAVTKPSFERRIVFDQNASKFGVIIETGIQCLFYNPGAYFSFKSK